MKIIFLEYQLISELKWKLNSWVNSELILLSYKTGKTRMNVPFKLLNGILWTKEFALKIEWIKSVNMGGKIGLIFLDIIPDQVLTNILMITIYVV